MLNITHQVHGEIFFPIMGSKLKRIVFPRRIYDICIDFGEDCVVIAKIIFDSVIVHIRSLIKIAGLLF